MHIPWLPDLLSGSATVTLTGRPLMEAFGRQIAFLRAMAAGAPATSALQLRFTAETSDGRIRCHMVGAADTETDAALLNQIVATGLPPEYPIEPVAAGELDAVMRIVDPDALALGSVVEIRRRIGHLDPTLPSEDRDEPILLPWSWSPQAMLSSLGLLRYQPATTQLIVQVERAALPADVAVFLQDELGRLVSDAASGEENPLLVAVHKAYRRWLYLLPQGCLALRMLLASSAPLVPGLAESLSTDLTRSFEASSDGGFATADVVVPDRPAELDACAALMEELRADDWRTPAQPALARLMHLFDPLEANTAFRLPIAPRGGLAGIGSRRLPSLAMGDDASDRHGNQGAIRIGSSLAGGEFSLGERDLNQHVLVAGLPGFGKTSTLQLMLGQLAGNAGLPFLVIDPAKRDYEGFFAELIASGVDARVHRLGYGDVALNPIAVPEGVEPGVHAGRLIAAFDSALQLSERWPFGYMALSRIVYQLLESAAAAGRQATLRDLYRAAGDYVAHSGLSRETRQDVEGSLLGRLEYLACGPTGRALSGGPGDAVPWADVLARPTLIELGAFAGPAERALIFGLLIAGLVSYREANPLPGRLGHVTVLEEAHRVLRPASVRDSGVEVFADAIAELRGAGEGFIVVEQAPSMLHPAILKLTGTKLVHRLVDSEERSAVGATMVLDGAQLDDLARLGQRRLVAYAATGATATLVDVDEVAAPAASTVPARSSLVDEPSPEVNFCVGCPVMCEGWRGMPVGAELARSVAVAHTSADDLLEAARAQTRTSAEAYCASAAAIGLTYRNVPASRRLRLQDVQASFRRKTNPRPLVPA